MRALAALGSWVAISALLYGLLATLLILRCLRQLLIVLAAWIMQGDHPVHRGAAGAAPPAVRGGLPHRVGRVGAAVLEARHFRGQ